MKLTYNLWVLGASGLVCARFDRSRRAKATVTSFTDTSPNAAHYGQWTFTVVSEPAARPATSSCTTSGVVDWDVEVEATWTAPGNGTACPRGADALSSAVVVVDSQAELQRVWQ